MSSRPNDNAPAGVSRGPQLISVVRVDFRRAAYVGLPAILLALYVSAMGAEDYLKEVVYFAVATAVVAIPMTVIAFIQKRDLIGQALPRPSGATLRSPHVSDEGWSGISYYFLGLGLILWAVLIGPPGSAAGLGIYSGGAVAFTARAVILRLEEKRLSRRFLIGADRESSWQGLMTARSLHYYYD